LPTRSAARIWETTKNTEVTPPRPSVFSRRASGRGVATALTASERSSGGRLRLCRFLAPAAEVLAGLLVNLTHAELYFAPVIETEHLDLDRIAQLDHLAHSPNPLRRQLADMHEPVARAEKIHERTEIHHLDDFPGIDDADLRLGHDAAYPI